MESRDVVISLRDGSAALEGSWTVPDGATGVVLFAHGSGSSRFSRRNAFVAERLQRAGLTTLLLDLLSKEEEQVDERTGALRFDIPLLAARVVEAITWTKARPEVASLPLGLFGASTGAAAALLAAAARPYDVRAVVSRGGRPDLAHGALAAVRAPTLLIVGGRDTEVLRLNELALHTLSCAKELAIVEGATHLFEEDGALARVAELAVGWLARFLPETEKAALAFG